MITRYNKLLNNYTRQQCEERVRKGLGNTFIDCLICEACKDNRGHLYFPICNQIRNRCFIYWRFYVMKNIYSHNDYKNYKHIIDKLKVISKEIIKEIFKSKMWI